jgi:lipid II:glycine glycyltransferase (peptidoglycan interpeptide bridge formation enzyme)
MTDLRQTNEYAKYLQTINWTVKKINGVYYFIRKIPLLGNIIKIQRPNKFDNKEIDKLAKKYKPFQIIFEPDIKTKLLDYRLLTTVYKFKVSKSAYLPSKTVYINLTKSDEELLKEMHYKTRYNIKKVISQKLKVKSCKDILTFASLWQRCALSQRGMIIPQKREIIKLYEAFKDKSDILLCYKSTPNTQQSTMPSCHAELSSASKILKQVQDDPPSSSKQDFGRVNKYEKQIEDDNKLLGGILLVYSDSVGYYMYACSTKEGKKLFAPTILAWEAIKVARKRGMKTFDFEGIYDERYPLKSWLGFSRFKKSFGGKIIEFPNTYIKTRFWSF